MTKTAKADARPSLASKRKAMRLAAAATLKAPPPPAAAEPVAPSTTAAPAPTGKLATLVALLRREQGATIADMTAATGWQAHSVRGAIAGSLKKKLALTVSSAKADGVRTYRIAEPAAG